MLEKAIEKLKKEMESNKDACIQRIGNFLLEQLNVNPAASEKILAQDKTIVKSFNEMRKAAEKKKVGNCAVLTDQEGFDIVLKYFGIDKEPVKEKADIDFDLKLEDIL